MRPKKSSSPQTLKGRNGKAKRRKGKEGEKDTVHLTTYGPSSPPPLPFPTSPHLHPTTQGHAFLALSSFSLSSWASRWRHNTQEAGMNGWGGYVYREWYDRHSHDHVVLKEEEWRHTPSKRAREDLKLLPFPLSGGGKKKGGMIKWYMIRYGSSRGLRLHFFPPCVRQE